MTLISLIINVLVFLLLFNWSYIQNRRENSDYPVKPISRSLMLPISLGIAYTLLVDMYKGLFYYQLLLFFIVAGVLFWKFYGWKKKGE
jgi:lipoprotein signal peptidase